MQHVPQAHRYEISHCGRCRSQLEHCAGTHHDSTLAAVIAWLLLLPGVVWLPFLSTTAGGITLTNHLTSSLGALWNDGQPLLAVAFLLRRTEIRKLERSPSKVLGSAIGFAAPFQSYVARELCVSNAPAILSVTSPPSNGR
jgi:Paraquat-inducible protein A